MHVVGGDDDADAAVPRPLDSVFQQRRVVRVEVRCGFVQQHDRRVNGECPRERDTLGLAAGQRERVLIDRFRKPDCFERGRDDVGRL